jgi:hypothetical protein
MAVPPFLYGLRPPLYAAERHANLALLSLKGGHNPFKRVAPAKPIMKNIMVYGYPPFFIWAAPPQSYMQSI